jgi:tetratricopeptide (TPR) repeat protein
MPNPTSEYRKSFDENLGILFEELELAIKWERPSILLTVHKSKFGQDKASKALEERLNTLGKSITKIIVNNEHPDVAHSILATSTADQTIFFVSNIDWGGGQDGKEAYRALNLYRELFVEQRIKAVFWLTPGEAANLSRYAPDFWSFRHRVIEFTAQRTLGKVTLPSGILIWQVQDSIDSFDKPETRITAREEILAKLPDTTESLSTRIELLYNIGYLYWVLGNSDKASKAFSVGFDLAKEYDLPQIRSKLLNGTAILYYEEVQFDQAIKFFKEAIVSNPSDNSLLINLSTVCCAVGRNQEAMTISKRALRMNSTDAKIWNRLGYIYCAMQKFDEALPCFTKASELAPQIAAYQESLAIVYNLLKRSDEAMRRLEIARKLAGNQAAYRLDIYEETFNGKPEEALNLLQKAVETNHISLNDVQRDPNINLLFERSQLESITY